MNYSIRLSGCSALQTKALKELGGGLSISICDEASCSVTVSVGDHIRIYKSRDEIYLTYRRPNELFRAFSMLPDFLESGKEVCEQNKYEMLCYMGDNSRNAVYNMQSAKRMIRYLAMMGYDSMMLYTEDTYEIPEYPYFGHMRGRFSETELKELDAYAALFGIELIPCIQTLAHLSTALRWPDFDGYKDNDDILLVGDERTYQFVEAVLRQCKRCFRSNRINLGMDEAHFIACGQYLKKNGYRKPSDVMLEHLNRVVKMCADVGYQPMIWSDMFFRMQFDGLYRVAEGMLLQEVVDKVPKGLELVYWDYYSNDEKLFSHMLDCHEQFQNPILFAGGAWKWYGYGAHNAFSLKSSRMQLDQCEKRGIKQIIVTAWGDNGGMASQFSILATLLYYAERNYAAAVNEAVLDARGRACFSATFEELMAFDLPDQLAEITPEFAERPRNPSHYLLFNDPLERLMDCHLNRSTAAVGFAENGERLMALAEHPIFGYAFEPLGRLCRALAIKCEMGWRLHEAYSADDRVTLQGIAREELPRLLSELELFIQAYRKQWYLENKTFGFITQEIRLGGLVERLRSVQQRLLDYVSGAIAEIEELRTPPLPFRKEEDGNYISFINWKGTVAAGIL